MPRHRVLRASCFFSLDMCLLFFPFSIWTVADARILFNSAASRTISSAKAKAGRALQLGSPSSAPASAAYVTLPVTLTSVDTMVQARTPIRGRGVGREAFLLPSFWPMGPSFITICHKAEEVCVVVLLWMKGGIKLKAMNTSRMGSDYHTKKQSNNRPLENWPLCFCWRIHQQQTVKMTRHTCHLFIMFLYHTHHIVFLIMHCPQPGEADKNY